MDKGTTKTKSVEERFQSFVDWVNADAGLPSLKELEEAHSHTEHAEHHMAPETDSAGMEPVEHSEEIPLMHEEMPAHTSDTADLSESDAEEPTEEYLEFIHHDADEELMYPDSIVLKEEPGVKTILKEELSSAAQQFMGWLEMMKRFYSLLAVLLTVVIVGALLVTVSHLPAFGETGNPAQNIVYDKYVDQGVEDTGAVNLVAGIILDYRAFDTLGESLMLFTGTMGVIMLLRETKTSRKSKAGKEER